VGTHGLCRYLIGLRKVRVSPGPTTEEHGMTEKRTAHERLDEFFRNRSRGGLTMVCQDGSWTASAEAAIGAVGSTGRWTTTITVVGAAYAGGAKGIEKTCQDVINRLTEVGLSVP
jgi:hypothetical protein